MVRLVLTRIGQEQAGNWCTSLKVFCFVFFLLLLLFFKKAFLASSLSQGVLCLRPYGITATEAHTLCSSCAHTCIGSWNTFSILGQNLPSGIFPSFVLTLGNSCELDFALPVSLFRTLENLCLNACFSHSVLFLT